MMFTGSGWDVARDLMPVNRLLPAIIQVQRGQKVPVPAQPGDPQRPGLQCVGIPHYQLVPRRVATVQNGGVTYGDTSLIADKVTIYMEPPVKGDPDQNPEGTVIAEGNCVLTSRLGKVAAQGMTFNYISKVGHADLATIDAPGLNVQAKSVDVSGTRYVLHDVVAKSLEQPPVYLIHAREIVVRLNQDIVARQAALSMFGHKLGTFPKLSKSLDERVSGFNYPTLSLNSSLRPGIADNSSILIDDYTAVSGSYNSEGGSYPAYSAQISRTTVAPGQTVGFITPRTDMDERFGYGYFDNVSVRNPKSEYDYVSAERQTFSFGTFWNRGTIDRLNYQVFSKPFQISYERSFGFAGLRSLSQVSVEDVRLEASEGYLQTNVGYGSDHIRFVGESVVETPPWKLSPALTGHARIAGSTFDGGNHSFSWVQSQIGAVYRLPRYFRVGGALVLASEFGDPLFLSDRLYSKNGFYTRADFNYGPRSISVISRWDFDRNKFFDHELMFSQLSGLFAPFIAIRSFPSSIRIGVQMRIDNVFKEASSNGAAPGPRDSYSHLD